MKETKVRRLSNFLKCTISKSFKCKGNLSTKGDLFVHTTAWYLAELREKKLPGTRDWNKNSTLSDLSLHSSLFLLFSAWIHSTGRLSLYSGKDGEYVLVTHDQSKDWLPLLQIILGKDLNSLSLGHVPSPLDQSLFPRRGSPMVGSGLDHVPTLVVPQGMWLTASQGIQRQCTKRRSWFYWAKKNAKCGAQTKTTATTVHYTKKHLWTILWEPELLQWGLSSTNPFTHQDQHRVLNSKSFHDIVISLFGRKVSQRVKN